ncbi:histidinol phosphatase [Clostridium botulinum A2 117]|uniref:PHP domain-containing protein n=1 Tax=Clostridium botulinum TaxID=1491 RepID=UPI0007DFBBCB|nr:PHP domain-containing protein [Clostridium botulinum]KEI77787.1 histidinol phosphatase [Clostridium botulinum A2 117]MBN3414959.1 PHP domain-containing protein [Clostridium botulinum]MBN3441252.1 PHP domain-containing protein [Clostridium botulinum]MBY6805320.1 PHP domain-containing protein [Clostridium botulinum]MCS4469944.1 PHP domain-containing protein [Clostridium botulinum]
MSYIDLHMHSLYSDDGEFKPQTLVDLCLERNIKYFSITDHNCIRAIEEAKEYCTGKDIEMISAIELDCTIDKTNLHVLGYGIDYHNPIFHEIEEFITLQERVASKKRMKLIRELGIYFSDEVITSLSRNGIVNGEMIAEAAMKFDKNHVNPLLIPYYENGSRSDNPYVNFYWDYCAQGKPAYVEIKFMDLQEAIKIIEESGGIPVLAHPGNNVKENMDLLESIISCGIMGIEVYSSYHSKEQVAFYREFALRHKLLLTCGSDFHGKTKPSISIGGTDCEGNEENIISELKFFLKSH